MNQEKGPVPGRRRNAKIAVVLLFINMLGAALIYLGMIVWRSKELHSQHVRWSGSVYRVDAKYGYFPKSDVLAFHSLKSGEKVPVFFDANGFRVPFPPRWVPQPSTTAKMLFLGGSMTHGYGVRAEDAFAYVTADMLGAQAWNAGGSGWGLSHMVMRAADVIPKLRPDFVVVEYSNRLAGRSMRVYGPTNWAKSPVPYFYLRDREVDIQPPVFESMNFKLAIWESEGMGLVSFAWRVGVPLFVHDDLMSSIIAVQQQLKMIPSPLQDRGKIESHVYASIQFLCDSIGAKMIIVSLPEHFSDRPRHELERDFAGRIVETIEPLKAMLPRPTRASWDANYRLKSADGSRVLDKHPNARMHAAIAKVLAGALTPVNQGAVLTN